MDLLGNLGGFVFLKNWIIQNVEAVPYSACIMHWWNFPDEVFSPLNFSDQQCEKMLSSNIYWIWYLGRRQGAGRLGQR